MRIDEEGVVELGIIEDGRRSARIEALIADRISIHHGCSLHTLQRRRERIVHAAHRLIGGSFEVLRVLIDDALSVHVHENNERNDHDHDSSTDGNDEIARLILRFSAFHGKPYLMKIYGIYAVQRLLFTPEPHCVGAGMKMLVIIH